MPNITHLKVLLSKDFLTLKRNIGFIIAFIVLPVGLMWTFIEIQSLVDDGNESGSLIDANFRYTSTQFMDYGPQLGNLFTNAPYMDVLPFNVSTDPSNVPPQAFASNLMACQSQTKGKYYYNKVAIIASDPTVRQDMVTFFDDYVLPSMNFPSNWSAEGFENQEECFNIFNSVDEPPYCFAVTLNDFDTATDNYNIDFSFGKTDVPDTTQPAFNPLIKAPDLTNYGMWFTNGAPHLYAYITEFIARSKTSKDFSNPKSLYNQTMGYAPMSTVEFMNISPLAAQQLSMNFPFFFMIIYLIPFYYLTSKIAAEKESKAREGMKMMGLTDSTYYLSWLILYSCIATFTSIIITILCAIGVFKQVDMILFLFFCLAYSLTLYGWAFCIVAFLPTKSSSGIAATLLHVISYYMCFIIADPSTPMSVQYAMSILPNVCMAQLIKQIFFYNLNTGSGLTWSTMSVQYQNYTFRGGLLIMVGNAVFYGLLGIYLDQIISSQYGVSKPWNFLCKRKQVKVEGNDSQPLLSDEETNNDARNFETVSDALKKQEKNKECLQVRGLVKQFGPKKAVDGTNLTMYNGQIFALLGHNGAGKTTTLSMLSGLLEPTDGRAEVFGINMFTDMAEIRKQLGVCPQHDVLFEFLTPVDHLRLFAAFKGTPADEIEKLVSQMLEDIDLVEVKDQLSKSLSGGQKRKLSVAIAMIGNSKIVMLDEPSSGMDTSARRRMWEMLKKYKQGRIVILTTHYMDEADILGDRIAIMAEGKVQCTGSSLFLKNRYGVGYNLVIAKKSRDPAPQIDKFVFSHIENVKKMQEVSSEVSYQLPTSSSKQFKKFFSEFDQNLDNLGIRSYGVGITTLEEVFLKIGHGEELEQEKFDKNQALAEAKIKNAGLNGTQDDASLAKEVDPVENYSIVTDSDKGGFVLFKNQMCALLKKKILMQVRDKKTLSIDTIFPVLLIIVGLALSTISFIKNSPPREMTPFVYSNSLDFFYNTNSGIIQSPVQEPEIPAFMTNSWKGMNATEINLQGTTTIDVTNPADLLNHVKQFDSYTFNLVNQSGHEPFYGQFYVNSLNDAIAQSEQSNYLGYSGVMMVNATSQSAVGIYGAFAHTAFLRHYLEANTAIEPTFKLQINDVPFPISKQLQSLNKTIAGTNAAILMTIAWMMISDSLVQNIIRDRQKNIKHQIMVSGSGLLSYWVSNFIADATFHFLPAAVGLIGVHAFGIDVPDVGYLFLAVVFCNPSFLYVFTFFFDKDESGSLVVKMFYFLFGVIAPIAVSILQVISTTENIANILRWFFYPLPIFSLTFGYMSIAQRQIIQFAQGLKELPDPLSSAVAGPSLCFLVGMVPVYWILVAMFEFKMFDCLKKRQGSGKKTVRQSEFTGNMSAIEDTDVIEEQIRIKNSRLNELPVRVQDVVKNYGDVRAVDNVSFGLEYGECFALLGISGAGKTSIFKCLTGEIYPSKGMLTINGANVNSRAGFEVARKQIGYCPQFDAIFEGLTVKEHLEIYASLKGIQPAIRGRLVQRAMEDMDLLDYVNIRANNLSGGNKRKMSVAMALLGNPPLVFLDEPSTGVDPQAKRFMWNIVSKISTLRKKSAVIITTHSMEEAEALSTKMGIMVDGQFKCYGSSQNIKNKYGTGYEIELKIRTLPEKETLEKLGQLGYGAKLTEKECKDLLVQQDNGDLIDEMKENGLGSDYAKTLKIGLNVDAAEFLRWQFAEGQGSRAIEHLEGKFQSLNVIEHYGNSFKLKVSRDNYSIGYLFGMMEDIQTEFDISEYSVTQTTLEQIFNNFAIEAEIKKGSKERKTTNVRRRSTQGKRPSNDIIADNEAGIKKA